MIPPRLHVATPPGTLRADDVDGVVVVAEVDVIRRLNAMQPRVEPAVVLLLRGGYENDAGETAPGMVNPPACIAASDDAASGDPETAYGTLWVERSGARVVGDVQAGIGERYPDVAERVLLWMRVQRGCVDDAYGYILRAVNAMVDYCEEALPVEPEPEP